MDYCAQFDEHVAELASGYPKPDDDHLFDVVAQGQGIDRWSARWAFWQLKSRWGLGHIAVFRIGLGATPWGNNAVDENNSILSCLGPVFSAHADCRPAVVGDGWFKWDEPVSASAWGGSTVPVGPCSVPLEIGSTRPGTTYMHMVEGLGLARWPYGHSEITVLVKTSSGIHEWGGCVAMPYARG